MRTLVDVPEEDLALLTAMSRRDGVSRAELMRRAISAYLEPRRGAERESAFGLWAERGEDGVAYQERMRGEWPE